MEGDEIVLDPGKAETYSAVGSEHHAALLHDLASLRDFELQDPEEFALRHGLLWHGPDRLRQGELRESLQWWGAVGEYLTMTISLYAALKKGVDEKSAEPVRDHMREHRDDGLFFGAIPDNNDELLEYASVQLAGMINSGLQNCKQTLIAACGIEKAGKKVGPAGDFRYRTEPANLVGAAYEQLARLVVTKREARLCKGCGRWFTVEHGSQTHHTPECGRNKRRRKSYRKAKAGK